MLRKVARRCLFTTKPNDQCAPYIAVSGITSQYLAKHLVLNAVIFQRTAGGVSCGKNSIDIGPLFHSFCIKAFNHLMADRCTAIHGGNDCDVVSSANSTIGSVESHEFTVKRSRRLWRGSIADVVRDNMMVDQVVAVDVRTDLDIFFRKSNGLSIFHYRRVVLNRTNCNFMSRWNIGLGAYGYFLAYDIFPTI